MRFMNKPHQREPFKLQGSQNHKFDSRQKLHKKVQLITPWKLRTFWNQIIQIQVKYRILDHYKYLIFVAQKILVILFSFSFENKLKVAKLLSQFPLIRL